MLVFEVGVSNLSGYKRVTEEHNPSFTRLTTTMAAVVVSIGVSDLSPDMILC